MMTWPKWDWVIPETRVNKTFLMIYGIKYSLPNNHMYCTISITNILYMPFQNCFHKMHINISREHMFSFELIVFSWNNGLLALSVYSPIHECVRCKLEETNCFFMFSIKLYLVYVILEGTKKKNCIYYKCCNNWRLSKFDCLNVFALRSLSGSQDASLCFGGVQRHPRSSGFTE